METKKTIYDFSYDELIGRNSALHRNPEIEEEFRNRVVLITGAAGFIGKELCRILSSYKVKKLVLLDIAETPLFEIQQELINNSFNEFNIEISNITYQRDLDRIFNTYRPEIVFHAAAYKHVPLMENNPYAAVRSNIIGTKELAKAAVRFGVAKFIFISSDKAVNPSNVMGASKRVAELYLSCLKDKGRTKFITTRFGNVLGSTGSVIPIFEKQIKSGGPITITHPEMTRYFMSVSEACNLVLESSGLGHGGELFTFDMGIPVKIMEIAKRMISLAGLKYPNDISINFSGLRPGEKLHEELFIDGDNTITTYHDKILITRSKSYDIDKINTQINYLCSKYEELQNIELVALLKQIVPEYLSRNSKFEILDD